MSGPDGSIEAFARLGVKQEVYLHINNSTPALNANSVEGAAINARGWTIGQDGMRFVL
jgi:pyrroloquinoline quinone biosynthesis protein B